MKDYENKWIELHARLQIASDNAQAEADSGRNQLIRADARATKCAYEVALKIMDEIDND